MNVTSLVSVLLVVVALVVLVVALGFFFTKKEKPGAEEGEGTKEATSTSEGPGGPGFQNVLNVVTYLRDDKVEELKTMPNSQLFDARAKQDYKFRDVTVTVAVSEVENYPGYTKFTHTLPSPFKPEHLMFDSFVRHDSFEDPVTSLTVYWWFNSLLFLTFKTLNEAGSTAKYYHFTALVSESGLVWSKFAFDPTRLLDPSVLGTKLDELNAALGNAVVMNLDEFVEGASGTYTTELSGFVTTFTLTKASFTKDGFYKVTHKLLNQVSEDSKPFKLKRLDFSGSELSDMTLPNKPVLYALVYWWYNMPLLVEFDLQGGTREYLTYNFETNNWLKDTVTTVRARLNKLKDNVGVPLVLDLSKKPGRDDVTYTTNEVLVRVSVNDNSNAGFAKYTHRFATGKSHFVGSFLNAGTAQMGLPVMRLNELSVYFSEDVPLLLEMNLALSGGSDNKVVYYTSNGFGFWTKSVLAADLKTPSALLKKLVAENKKLVADNDKYVVDVSAKNNYLSFGKLLTVTKQSDSTHFPDYELFLHKAKNNAPFKFEKLSVAGNDVKSEGVALQSGVTTATVYWFLDRPLAVKLEGTGPGTPPPQTAPSESQQVSQASQQGNQQSAQNQTQNVRFTNYYAYNGESELWKKTELDPNSRTDTNAGLKKLLDTSRASLGSVTVNVGHSAGTYKSGPVNVVVTSEPFDTKKETLYDKMVHELSSPFTLGNLKSFDFVLKLKQHKASSSDELEDFSYKNFVLKKVEVYVYKYVPLAFRLVLKDGTMHYFSNNVDNSTWVLFTPTANKSVLLTLNEVRAKLNKVSTLDVCRKLTGGSATTYELAKDAGSERVQVTLSPMEVSNPGLTGLSHKFSSDVKLSSMTCNGELLTGLDYASVRNVYVYDRGGVPVVVKTNSDPKFFRSDGTGLLALHPLPQGTNDLTAEQVGTLLNQVSEDLGPVFELNLQSKASYTSGGTVVNVTAKPLNEEWSLYTHSGQENVQKFTVSKFLKGTEDVAGLPYSSSFSSVVVGLKGDVPHVLALKTVNNPRYVWYVFNKYTWFFDFESDELLEDSELLGYMLDVEDGLDNEYDFELSPGLHSDSFALDYHDLYLDLESYKYLSYVPFSNKFPFLVKSLMYDSALLEVPDLNSRHLKWLSAYTLWKVPVVLNAFTHDNKHLFYENTFEGSWKRFELAELSEETLNAKLKEVKDRASANFSPELTMKTSYVKYGFAVDVTQSNVNGNSGFKKYVHKLPKSADGKPDKPFKVPFLTYNYVPLSAVMPKGTMTQVEVYQNDDGVPLGVYLLATQAATSSDSGGTSTSKQTHNYFFNTSGEWVAHDKTDAALEVNVLKTKLTEANKLLDFYVEVDLAHKLPYVFSKDVKVKRPTEQGGQETTEKKAVDFLVAFNPRPFYKYTRYTHVPQVRVGTEPVKTQDFVPFVTSFKQNGKLLKGFELSKVVKFTVYWLDDTFPLFVHVTTSNANKYYGRKEDDDWVLLKTSTNALDDVGLYWLLTMARKNFAYGADVELTGGLAAGYWERYFTNGLAMKVVDQGFVGTSFKSYLHTSASVLSPTFKLLNFNLWGKFVYKVPNLGYTHYVRVFTDLQDFPLLVEVGSSLYNSRNGPLRHYYFSYFPDPNFGWLVHMVLESKTKLNDDGLLKLLKPLANHSANVHVLSLDMKAQYLSKTGHNVNVEKANQTPVSEFEVWTHTLNDQTFKTLLLKQNGKLVALVDKVLKFKLAKVYWLKGVPVHVELEYDGQKDNAKEVKHRLHYFWTNGGVWNNSVGSLVTKETLVSDLNDKLLSYYTSNVTLDLGKRLKSLMTGSPTDLPLVEYKHENFDLPVEMVVYRLFSSDTGFKLDKVKNHGFDFAWWNLPLPTNNVYRVVVYSPDYFYSPVFLELLSKSNGSNNNMLEHYHYYYATNSGNWVFLDTNEKKLDLGHLRLKLESFQNPLPVLLDLGKKNGTYGLNELVVKKTMLHSANAYAKYVHKLTNGESFLTAKWVFGGLVLSKLPLVRANSVAVYYYQDLVPLLVEVVGDGLVRHFSVDAKGVWLPDNVSPTAVLSYLDYLVHDLKLFGNSTGEWVPHLYNKFLQEFEFVPEPLAPAVNPKVTADGETPASAVSHSTTGVTGAQVPTSAVSTAQVSLGTVSETRAGVLRTVTSQERQQTSNVESTGQVAQVAAALSGNGLKGNVQSQTVVSGTDSTQSTAPGTPNAKAAVDVPTVKPTTGADGVSGSSNSVLPLSTAAATRKPRRSFRLVPLDFDKLFFAYVTLGKFVVVNRFEYVPYGYNFSRHTLLDFKSFFNKFFLNDRMYSVSYEPALSLEKRRVKSLGFYSWADNPLLLKLGFDNKSPKFFSFNKTDDNWNAHNVVNLDEELEDLNNSLNDAFVFELSKPLKVEYKYFNNSVYRTSVASTPEDARFYSVEYKTYRYKPAKSSLVDDVYTLLKFKVAKLRLNGVDLSVDGLPVDMSFYMLKVYSSKSLGKPLVLVLSDYKAEADGSGPTTTVTDSTVLNTHYHYHLNAEGSWTFFVCGGDNTLNNKLAELERLFAVPKALDLAVVTGAATSLWYKTNHEDFTVDRVYFQFQPRPQQPSGTDESSSVPQFKVVDPLVGLPVKSELPGSGLFLNVPLASYRVPVGPELDSGFELFLHHKPYFLHSVASTSQQPVNSNSQGAGASQPAAGAAAGAGAGVGAVSGSGTQAGTNAVSGAGAGAGAGAQAGFVKFQKFLLNELLLSGFRLDFSEPFNALEDGYAGLTVYYQKNATVPFMFALFAPLENSGSVDKASYHVWVHRELKWVKTTELEEFHKLMRSVELRLDLSEFGDLVPKFWQLLTKFSNESKALLTNPFWLDLNQEDRVTYGDVVVTRDADVLPEFNLVKVTFTPSLNMGDSNAANFTLQNVTAFGNKYAGLKFPLCGVVRVNLYFRNEPDRYAKFPVLMEFVQKVPESGTNKLNHNFYGYQGGNEWKFLFNSVNKLEEHEVSDLVGYLLYQYYRVSRLRENALLLDLDTKFSHLSWGRFVDSVEFHHDPTANAPLSPVPEGFLLYRHSMATENTTFTLPFFKLQGHVKETGFKFPFAQYFVYYKVGEYVPFVFVLAKADNLEQQPEHHWYFVKKDGFVKFKFDQDVDPDNKDSKDKVAAKFKQLLSAAPTPLTEQDSLKELPKGDTKFPTFPATDPGVLSKPTNGVLPKSGSQPESKRPDLSGQFEVGSGADSWF